MARPLKGSVQRDDRWARPIYSLRFTANGKRQWVTLGSEPEWSQARAEEELEAVLALVRRGLWTPPERVDAPREIPTFHEFSSEWFARQVAEGGRNGDGLTAAGKADLEWRLTSHLLPTFAEMRLDEITAEDVDRYRLAKVKAGKLNATSINKTLAALSAILESAHEYELVRRNVAKGRRRRLPKLTPNRTWLDRAEHVAALLNGATALDRAARTRAGQRRALIATLTFAGLRIGEALALRWRDVDLARGTITVRAGKTAAAARTVNILPVLGDELRSYAAATKRSPGGLVFATTTGAAHGPTNIRKRVLAPAIAKANELLAVDQNGVPRENVELIPTSITPHSLRRTFASLLFAIGETPPYVMAQMGHTTAELTLAIYARVMDRRDGEPERLRALVEGRDWEIAKDQSTAGQDRHSPAPQR